MKQKKIQAVVVNDSGTPVLKLNVGDFVVNMPTPVASEIATAIFDAIRIGPTDDNVSEPDDDSEFDIDKIATSICSDDRFVQDCLQRVMKEYGYDGLTEEELIKRCKTMGTSDDQARKGIKKLHDTGIFYKTGDLYKLV